MAVTQVNPYASLIEKDTGLDFIDSNYFGINNDEPPQPLTAKKSPAAHRR